MRDVRDQYVEVFYIYVNPNPTYTTKHKQEKSQKLRNYLDKFN